jgi:hypothetical protein
MDLQIFIRLFLFIVVVLSLVCFNVISSRCRLSQIISLLLSLICYRIVLLMRFMVFINLILIDSLLWLRRL